MSSQGPTQLSEERLPGRGCQPSAEYGGRILPRRVQSSLGVALQGRRDSDAAEMYPSVQASLVGLS